MRQHLHYYCLMLEKALGMTQETSLYMTKLMAYESESSPWKLTLCLKFYLRKIL